ncbi:MAG: hypothetical protein I3273_00850 [Candidatus Moeniiplasma glomeromycotorum]|nr:hypothetical protein [Candidatus Moeniiplasma glomeromycotorum]MCE8167327.1 hypothetical protein [Candidatus Moeniiplasma glomeromycotorum]MCE8168659.1 hypothetical protein [Candidatus Moeniiplasma glomeromycotorum]
MNFSWVYQTPSQGWWANYRWHITKSSEELGLKSEGWKKSFFRSGWQNKTLEIEGIDNAKKCLQFLRNGIITAYGGRFRGASYDKNAERIIKQAKRSLKEAIKQHTRGESIKLKETAIVPPSYYNWGKIVIISVSIIFIIFTIYLILYFLIFRKKRTN